MRRYSLVVKVNVLDTSLFIAKFAFFLGFGFKIFIIFTGLSNSPIILLFFVTSIIVNSLN